MKVISPVLCHPTRTNNFINLVAIISLCFPFHKYHLFIYQFINQPLRSGSNDVAVRWTRWFRQKYYYVIILFNKLKSCLLFRCATLKLRLLLARLTASRINHYFELCLLCSENSSIIYILYFFNVFCSLLIYVFSKQINRQHFF